MTMGLATPERHRIMPGMRFLFLLSTMVLDGAGFTATTGLEGVHQRLRTFQVGCISEAAEAESVK